MAGIGFGGQGSTYKTQASTGIGPRTRVLSLSKTNMTQAELDSVIQFLSFGGVSGTNDAVTVAGVVSDGTGGAFVSGTSDVVYVSVQGTGALTAASNYGGVTGVTMAVVADFANIF